MYFLKCRLAIPLTIVCSFFLSIVAYGNELVLDLHESITLALKQNKKFQATQYALEAAHAQRREADALFWPVLEYQYRAAPAPEDADQALSSFFEGDITFFNSLRLSLALPVFTFGQLKTAGELADKGIAAEKWNREKEREKLIFEVKQLYYGQQLAYELRKILENSIQEIDGRVRSEEEKEIPEIAPINILKLKAFRGDLQQRLGEIEQNAKLAEAGMKIQLGLASEQKFRLVDPHLVPELVEINSLDAYVKATIARRPESNLIDVGVEAQKKKYELEKKKLLPKAGIGAFFDIGTTTSTVRRNQPTDDFSDPFNFRRVGVGLQIEGKLDFHGAKSRIEKTKAEYLKATYEREIAKQGIALECQKFYENAKRAHENVRQARKAQSLGQQMLFISKSNMDIGVGEKNEYVDSLKFLLLSRGEYFKAVFDYNVALADLARVASQAQYEHLTPTKQAEVYEIFGNGEHEEFELEDDTE